MVCEPEPEVFLTDLFVQWLMRMVIGFVGSIIIIAAVLIGLFIGSAHALACLLMKEEIVFDNLGIFDTIGKIVEAKNDR